MPRFMGGFGNSKSWSRTAAVPKCAPNKMTLMEAAAETQKKNKGPLRRARQQLAEAEEKGNKGAAKRARGTIKRLGGKP